MVDFSRRREPSINNRAGRPVLYIVRPGISVGTAQMTKGVTKSPFLHNIIALFIIMDGGEGCEVRVSMMGCPKVDHRMNE